MKQEKPLNKLPAIDQKRVLCPLADKADQLIVEKGSRIRLDCPESPNGNLCDRCHGVGRCQLSEEATARLVIGFNNRTPVDSEGESREA